VLDVLDSLVAQSLVVPSVDSDRYRLLETVRLYALDQLIAANEVTAARDKHLTWILTVAGFAAFADRLNETGDNWQYELDKLAEIDNIVAAMEWADENNNPDAVLELFRGTQTCWLAGGVLGRIGASWRDRIPQPPESDLAGRAGWLSSSGAIDFNLGEVTSALGRLLEAATIVDTLIDTDTGEDWFDSYIAIYFRGMASGSAGDIPAALFDADRLSELPNDPTGYAGFFSAHIKAIALLPQWTEESMAATVAAVDAARSVSEFAYTLAVAGLGSQLDRVGRHEEALAAILLCLDANAMTESVKIIQLPSAARPLTALGRYEEALEIVETDFGPMLDAQHHSLRVNQLLSLTIVLHGLGQIEHRDRLAAVSLKLATDWIASQNVVVSLVEILGSDESVAALREPDPTELTPDRITALISDTITEIRDVVAHRAPGR
jgi:tetratricopeptide (TPR) repeat protein